MIAVHDPPCVFNLQSTGVSFYDDFIGTEQEQDYKRLSRGLVGTIQYMPPDEYFFQIAHKVFYKPISYAKRGLQEDVINDLVDKMTKGVKIYLPYINYASQEQEGRHRATAAKRLGIHEIPVLCVNKWSINDEQIDLPEDFKFNLWYGHTINYIGKDGKLHSVPCGLNLSKIKSELQNIANTKQYMPNADPTR